MTMRLCLMSSGEIQDRLGVNRQRVYQLSRRPDWPEPYAELSIGRIWLREDIEAWIVRHRPHLSE
jgi:prophage regulatory protein